MLRLETKKIGENNVSNDHEVAAIFPTYSNVIKEPIVHFPTGHYVSLVSAYTPLKFNDVGQFSIKLGAVPLVNYDGTDVIKGVDDLLSRFTTNKSKAEITRNGFVKIKLFAPDPDTESNYTLNLSPSAAWYLGFQNKTNVFKKIESGIWAVCGEVAHPPATIRYLQVICKNACGTTDSNMTMPTTMGIMHVTDDLTLINPHIAVNHRIEKGRVIDIEILDQDDHPFRWAPVYLELFVSESAEHEKRQGFFRFEKSHAVHLHAPVKMISIPNVFAAEQLHTIKLMPAATVSLTLGDKTEHFFPANDAYCKSLVGTVLTRNAVLKVFQHIDAHFRKVFKKLLPHNYDLTFIDAAIIHNALLIRSYLGIFEMNDFMHIIDAKSDNLFKKFTIMPREVGIYHIDPNVWYNDNARLHIYCKEYHDRIPVAVARRIRNYYQIVNRVFWAWHEFEKAANELHFRVERVITYPDGTVAVDEWPADKELLLQLFYK